jgi:hypothetical protein
MATLQREFYRSARGPAPADEDSWRLIFDRNTKHLFIRHEWQTTGHNGVDEFEIAKFLEHAGAEQAAFIESLFLVHAEA